MKKQNHNIFRFVKITQLLSPRRTAALVAMFTVLVSAISSPAHGAPDDAPPAPPAPPAPQSQLHAGEAIFQITNHIKVPAAPHGVAFSSDGATAYVAGSGANKIAVIDLRAHKIIRELDAGEVPLDVILAADQRSLIATQFRKGELLRIPLDPGAKPTPLSIETIKEGASLFSPEVQGKRYLVCEYEDTIVELHAPIASHAHNSAPRSWKTPDAPYPADLTADGVLLFVPCRGANSVQVIDTLNNTIAAEVPVGEHPEGGAVTHDNTSYIVASGAANEINYINTASFEVINTITEGVGERPFSVTLTTDGAFGVINNSGANTISILDVKAKKIVGDLTVGAQPIVVRAHPDGHRLYISCEGDDTFHELRYTPAPTPPVDPNVKTEVVVLGMIHSGHLTSEKYSVAAIQNIVRLIDPDAILTEIPPNRLERAMHQLKELGAVTEPRVSRFPEYIDAIFPMLSDKTFRIIPCAGWTAEMNNYRNAQLKRLAEDDASRKEWAEYEQAVEAMDRQLKELGPEDDPRTIHTDEYDQIIKEGLEPYNRHFNDILADGGWDNINAKHFALIESYLNQARGKGERILITFGAAHKYWFLEQLRARYDVTLLEVAPFLDALTPQRID